MNLRFSWAAIVVLILTIAVIGLGCVANNVAPQPTATPIRSQSVPVERSPGVVPVSSDAVLWVTALDDVVIESSDIEKAHPDVLAGQDVSLSTVGNEVQAAVSDDESVVALPVRTSSGKGGVALVRADGYKMALHLYGAADIPIGSIKFMPEFGITLLSLGDEVAGGKIVAINNYGMKLFELPVTDFTGTLRYSPDEFRYMAIDRRPLISEIELVPFDEPGDTALFRADDESETSNELYQSIVTAIADWK